MESPVTDTALAIESLVAALRHSHDRSASPPPSIGGTTLARALAIARDGKILSLVAPVLARGTQFEQAGIDYSARTLASNATLLRECITVSAAMDKEKVKYCILKGPHQQQVLLKTFFRRPAGDLDVLVDDRDFSAAGDVLIQIGFERVTPSAWWRGSLGEEHFERRSPYRVAVDLHHRVGQPGVPGGLTAQQVFAELTSVGFGGAAVATPDRNMALLVSVISIAKALYNREPSAAYVSDIVSGLMAGAPGTVSSLLTFSTRHGLFGSAVVALRLVSEIYGPQLVLPPELPRGLPGLSREQILHMMFCPRAPETIWPKRRQLVWELSGHDPAAYLRAGFAILRSELTRRLFERGDRIARHLD